MSEQLDEKDIKEGYGDLYMDNLILKKQLRQTHDLLKQLRDENERLKEELNKNSETET